MSQQSTAQHCHIDTPFCTIRKSHVTWNFAVPAPHSEEIRRCILLFLCTLGETQWQEIHVRTAIPEHVWSLSFHHQPTVGLFFLESKHTRSVSLKQLGWEGRLHLCSLSLKALISSLCWASCSTRVLASPFLASSETSQMTDPRPQLYWNWGLEGRKWEMVNREEIGQI